jgi:hypothetical protein
VREGRRTDSADLDGIGAPPFLSCEGEASLALVAGKEEEHGPEKKRVAIWLRLDLSTTAGASLTVRSRIGRSG